MNTTKNTVTVRPRNEGDPEPDLTLFLVIHRAMRGEVRRLAALTAEQGGAPFPPAREAALQRMLAFLSTTIRVHHTEEDTILWPVVTASAGAAVDLLPLTEDHGEIDPYLERIRTTTGRTRAEALASLRDLLDEHITEEEGDVFPVILRYVSAEDFAECQKRFQKEAALSQLRYVVPLIAHYADPAELAHLLKKAGPAMRVLLRLSRSGYEKLQREVYGVTRPA
ncbi:hemerythrin domain-containing protein [Actinocorallia sp. B10E7]|uniref:hemerythrin domain-containing protein n=1 Tax=Actinocorallia sp. B10E7 TaxID=3153558 RepID=UPI00325DBB1A